MNKTTKILIWLIVVIVVIAGIWWRVGKKSIQPPTGKKEVIKIGVITLLTGPGAEYGIATQRGLDLAVKEINDAGGIKGKKIKLIYEDSKCDPQTGIRALQKLIFKDKVKVVIGTVCSSVTLALAPIAQEQDLLIISSGSSNPRISSYPNVFRTWPSDAIQGKFLGKFVKEKLKLNKVGIIYMNNDYGVGLKDAFKDEFEKRGGTVVAEEAVPAIATDVKTQLTKLKELNPEGVFLATHAKEMGQILKQAKELNFSTQFFGGEGTKDPSLIEIGGSGAEGLIGTIPSASETSKRNHFLSAFKKAYDKEPGITADAAYDIPFLLEIALKECDISEINCIKTALLKIKNYSGASGIITFDENGDIISKKYDLIIVKNGKFVPYED